MKNICLIKKVTLGSLLVVPITFAAGYLLYLSVITNVSWWPVNDLKPIIVCLIFYAFFALVISIVVIAMWNWVSLIMRVGDWTKSKLGW